MSITSLPYKCIKFKRAIQVLKDGWRDSATIAVEIEKTGKKCSRFKIYRDILCFFVGHYVFSDQYRYERIWEASTEEKERIARRIGAKNKVLDAVSARRICRAAVLYDEDIINRMIQTNLSTMQMHTRTFLPFKGIHSGDDIVVVATGPSLKDFKPIPNCKYISVNHAFLDKRIEFDYAIAVDYYSLGKVMPQLNAYRKGKCVKFYGLHKQGIDDEVPNKWGVCEENRLIPESDALAAGALRFRTDAVSYSGYEVYPTYDLSSEPLCTMGSTAFVAMEFALWTNPRRIYIVGCDCSQAGHFYNEKLTSISNYEKSRNDVYTKMVGSWLKIKKFAARYYPATEIISVNPVGLKGVFSDLYQ